MSRQNRRIITDADDADPRIGLAAGAEFEYGLTDNIGLSAGVLYSMQGFKTTEDGADCFLRDLCPSAIR